MTQQLKENRRTLERVKESAGETDDYFSEMVGIIGDFYFPLRELMNEIDDHMDEKSRIKQQPRMRRMMRLLEEAESYFLTMLDTRNDFESPLSEIIDEVDELMDEIRQSRREKYTQTDYMKGFFGNMAGGRLPRKMVHKNPNSCENPSPTATRDDRRQMNISARMGTGNASIMCNATMKAGNKISVSNQMNASTMSQSMSAVGGNAMGR